MSGVARLDTGCWGDLIGVAGNPLEDLSLPADASRKALVVKGGEIFKERA